MRCPQCGYNRFDNLNTCSKCRADLSEERNRLNLPEGPLDPISLTEILKLVQAGPIKEVQAPGGTTKIHPAKPAEPKTMALNLGSDIPMEALAEERPIVPENRIKRPAEGFSVDLTLE
jgi:hypothetical protein